MGTSKDFTLVNGKTNNGLRYVSLRSSIFLYRSNDLTCIDITHTRERDMNTTTLDRMNFHDLLGSIPLRVAGDR